MNVAEVSGQFNSIAHEAIRNRGDQLYTDGSRIGLFIGRPAYWMNVQRDTATATAYEELLDIWGDLIDDSGRFTPGGLLAANLTVTDPSQQTLEGYVAQRYGFSEEDALNLTSRAMWDLLMIRGLPTTELPESYLK